MLHRCSLPMALLLATGVQAGDAGLSGQGAFDPAICSIYMTEAECSAHQRILTLLTELRERNAYLAMHSQLIAERAAACGVPTERAHPKLAGLDLGQH